MHTKSSSFSLPRGLLCTNRQQIRRGGIANFGAVTALVPRDCAPYCRANLHPGQCGRLDHSAPALSRGGWSSFSSVCPSTWENCAMPKRSSIGKRRSKALPALGFAGMSLSMASGACASTSEASANTSPPSQKHEIFLGEEEISDVSLATFYVFDKENAGPPPLFQKLRLAAGGGAGCACSFGCAYWPQPPRPPKATQPTQQRKKKPPHRTN